MASNEEPRAPNNRQEDETVAAGPPRRRPQTQSASGHGVGLAGGFGHGRFVPGTTLAGRYRIVGLLGQGGMGEVYRADDLQLGQAVALKFLPQRLAADEEALTRFRGEVRLAREVSHPNVCRVYDIAQADGDWFLTMEYVDGEDLASLLRRVRRIPADRATELAQQLCLGLAAAHDKGVLHRDLKPSNVMVDGRGKLLITDFGLAALAGGVRDDEIQCGTPAYMAPEQLAGEEVTIRSDIYSLGLVLHEMFTGRRAFAAETVAELIQERETTPTPASMDEAGEIDPEVERMVLQCLEEDPGKRPASVLSVAARLPGTDPLARALAAGETPAPELVAASGGEGSARPRAVCVALLCVVVGLVAAVGFSSRYSLIGASGPLKSPDVLVDRARELLTDLGIGEGKDESFGFALDDAFLREMRKQARLEPRVTAIKDQPPGFVFWYRRSPEYLSPRSFSGSWGWSRGMVTPSDPPPTEPGMVELRLDPRSGRVLRFAVIRDAEDVSRAASASGSASASTPASPADAAPDWRRLIAPLAPEIAKLVAGRPPTFSGIQSPGPVDAFATWSGVVYPEWPNTGWRVQAGALRGELVFLGVESPREEPRAESGINLEELSTELYSGLWIVVLLASAILAARNWRRGSVDKRGALRLACYVFCLSLASWALLASHRPSLTHEQSLLIFALALALQSAVRYWLFYVAFEPYVRRVWPETLISWSRLLNGRVRDALVGWHVLVGLAFAAGVLVLAVVIALAFEWLASAGLPLPSRLSLTGLLDIRRALGVVLHTHQVAIYENLQALMLLLLLRLLLKRRSLAAVAFWLLATVVIVDDPTRDLRMTVFYAVYLAAYVFLLTRYGLLSTVVASFVTNLLARSALTYDYTSWYSENTLVVLAIVGTIAVGAGVVACRRERVKWFPQQGE